MEKIFCIGALNIEPFPLIKNRRIILQEKRRFIILAIFCASLFCTGEALVTFLYNFIKPERSENVLTGTKHVDLYGIIFLATYAVTALLCPLIYIKIQLKAIIISGSIFNILVVVLKLIHTLLLSEESNFKVVLKIAKNLGLGCSMGLLFSIPTLVSIYWFAWKEQRLSSSIPVIS
ncbi:hypothetical protein MXB_1911, partial [Myxobolus squamalis]